MAEPPGQANPRSLAAVVWWRKKAWSVTACVLRYADGMVTLYDQDDALLFSVDAAQVGVRPMSGRRFALEVGGRTYVLAAVDLRESLRGSRRRKARRLAERYDTLRVPPPAPGMQANQYWRWVNRSTSAAAALAQHALWQQYWLRLLTEGGATRIPSSLWRQVDGQPGGSVRRTPTHGCVTTALIIVWMLVPLVSLGYLTWLTYLYAAIHVRRSRWLWLSALLVVALDGVYYWMTALHTPGEPAGGVYAGMMAMLSLVGSFYAWQLRRYVFYRV